MKQSDKNKKTRRKVLILLLNFVLLYALLRLIIALGEQLRSPAIYYIGSGAYMIAMGGLIVAYFVLNGGTFNRYNPTWDDLPSGKRWTDEKKAEFLRRLPERQAKARQLLYVLLPMLATIIISYIELFFLK